MRFEEFFGGLFVIGLLGFLIYLPIRFFLLIGQVKALEQRVAKLSREGVSAQAESPAVSAPAPSAVAPIVPPPLPVRPVTERPAVRPVAPVQPDPLFERLRDLGLLPPTDLKGEYALGAWWAVRIGGVLAVAAVVFLGIWLNLRSTIPPIVRVLEVALIGAGLFWGGLRLAAKRADLGQVVAAAGLAVWQFAAWATYGLDKMRVFDSAAAAATVQFAVAALIAGIALWKDSKLFGQLSVLFATVAVFFSVGAGTAPVPTATGAGLVAALGVLLMVRGQWGSAGVLGLVGSQVSLLFLYDAMPALDANYLPLQLAAAGSFLVLWIGERLVKEDAVLMGRDMRAAFQLAAFFAPACLSLFLATGGENDRACVSLLIAAVASIVGYPELRRHPLVGEILLLAAVGFVGAGLAWLVDPHLVWLIWALAAAATSVVGTRTSSELVRWASEILAGAAAFAFVDHPPAQPWIALAGIAALGLLLSFREDWERPFGWQQFRRILGILGLAGVVLAVQGQLPKADNGWPWLVVLLVAALRYRPALVWAAAPGFLFTSVLVVFWKPLVGGDASGWSVAWSAVVALGAAVALWLLIGRAGDGSRFLRNVLAFATAVLLFAFAYHVAGCLHASAAWRLAWVWAAGATLLVGLTAGWRRLGAFPGDLSLSALGALVGFFIQGVVAEGAGLRQLGLAHASFVLLGLAGLLYVLALHTREQGTWGTVQRVLFGAPALFFMGFAMLAHLPGAGVSLFWALASVLTFVLGHLLATRTLRMLGLIGLVVATIRVLAYDITDLQGRIAACGAVALAFFGIAWLYGRITADRKDA